jgi:hypothetical protein
MDVGSSADVTEMEVSVEISGIARRRETKSVVLRYLALWERMRRRG